MTTTHIDRTAPGEAADGARRTAVTAYTALGWVVLFFAFHVYWYLGGSFASPGELPPLVPHSDGDGSARARVQLVAMIVSVPVDSAWPIGAWVCLAIARGWPRGRLAGVAQILVWIGCVLLLLRGASGLLDDVTRATGLLHNGITGLSLEATTGHAHLRWADWAIDTYFFAGGIIFWLLAVRYRARRPESRRRGAPPPAAALGPLEQPSVPAWAERLAHVIPLLVLPSGLWRLAAAFGFSMGMVDGSGDLEVMRGWPAVYVAVISLVTEAVALTALGLVRPQGEEVPRWVPFFGGRAVRPRSVVVAATAGSVALMLIWTVGFWDVWTGGQAARMATPFWTAVFAICYAPLNLWGPALLTLTWAYRRRVRSTSQRGPRVRSLTSG